MHSDRKSKSQTTKGAPFFRALCGRVGREDPSRGWSAAFDPHLSPIPASSATRQEVVVILSEAKDLCTLSAAPAISALHLVVIFGIEVDGTEGPENAKLLAALYVLDEGRSDCAFLSLVTTNATRFLDQFVVAFQIRGHVSTIAYTSVQNNGT